MRKAILFLIVLPLMAFQCYDYEPWNPYSEYKPILMKRTQLENSVHFIEKQNLVRPGKIYFKGDTIYVNEKYKGVHVIDNSRPESPLLLGFITIPGCIDMAVKNNVLYADNAVDLVAVQLSQNLSDITVTKRIRNVFPELTAPDQLNLEPAYQPENRPENTIIVAWEKVKL
jgi:hypothetical protein